jgi:hypothetical protein
VVPSVVAVLATGLIGFGAVGCSRSRSNADDRVEPSGTTTTIYLQGGSGFSRLKVDVRFAANLDPAPHIKPIADAIAKVSAACFTEEPAVTAVTLHARTVHATAKGERGACLAVAIDGQPTDDPSELAVELSIRRSPPSGSARTP